MGRPKKGLLEYIARDIEDVFVNVAKETMIDLNNQLETEYEKAIWAFYNDYTHLKSYERTESTFYASSLYDMDARYNPEIKDDVIYGGLDLNDPAANMVKNHNPYGGKPYRADTNWVFERTFVRGIHGITNDEERHWGANKWWDQYLRSIRPKNRWNKGILVNQYRTYRYIAYLSYKGNDKNIIKRQRKHRFISAEINNKYSRIMKGKKPVAMFRYAYYKIGSQRNIKECLDKHLIEYMVNNRYNYE